MEIGRIRVRILAAAAILALTAGGAAYAGTALQAAKVKVVAIATPAQTNDYGWNPWLRGGGQPPRSRPG